MSKVKINIEKKKKKRRRTKRWTHMNYWGGGQRVVKTIRSDHPHFFSRTQFMLSLFYSKTL